MQICRYRDDAERFLSRADLQISTAAREATSYRKLCQHALGDLAEGEAIGVLNSLLLLEEHFPSMKVWLTPYLDRLLRRKKRLRVTG